MQSNSLIVATAGHVDHGKTSLVKHITGKNTDTLTEEQERGLTINVGFAYHQVEETIGGDTCQFTIGFVDVPGHIDFINNMLAGVGGVDFALLVIAADDGIMPQTREHLAIMDLLGISKGAVVLTKIDRVDNARINALTLEIDRLLYNTFLVKSPIFPVSNQSKDGIPDLISHLHWTLKNKNPDTNKNQDNNFRFLVDRAFTVKGIGTVVTGTTRSGAATKDTQIVCSRNSKNVRIRGLKLHEDPIEQTSAGQRAALNIDIDLTNVKRGDWLLSPITNKPITRFDASLVLLNKNTSINENAEYHLYIGASHHIVNLRYLNQEQKKYIQVKSKSLIVAHYGDRFVIRDPASEITIGGGQVVDIFVPRKKRSSQLRLKTLETMCNEDTDALKCLCEISSTGINLSQFSTNRNLAPTFLEKIIKEIQKGGMYKNLETKIFGDNYLLHKKFFDEHRHKILSEISEFHKNNPSQRGISEPALSRSLNFSGSHLLFSALLQSLINDNSIKLSGTLLHNPSHRAVLSNEEKEFFSKIKPILETAGTIPPRTRELVDLTNIPLKPLERILRETSKAGSLIRVADNRYYLPETIMALAEFTEKLVEKNENKEGFSVIQFRDESGIGRNLCIEILEYFDRVGFTHRDGNTRFVRTEKENIFGV